MVQIQSRVRYARDLTIPMGELAGCRGERCGRTHQAQMVKTEACPRPRIPIPILRRIFILALILSGARHPCSLADNGLSSRTRQADHPSPFSVLRRKRRVLTWCWCPGTSAVVNCVVLYSLSAGSTPACSESSSEMIFRTSGGIDGVQVMYAQVACPSPSSCKYLPLSTSLISPGGD